MTNYKHLSYEDRKNIKDGLNENKSIYQISITTLYRYINNDYLQTKRIDLPHAVKYKKESIIKV